MTEFTNPWDTPKNDDAIPAWLAEQLTDKRPFLLAFADDGVIWGKMVAGKLSTSHEIDDKISPALRGETLQQAFVFGPDDEVRLFRTEQSDWKALQVVDGAEIIHESQILWGDRAYDSKNGFTRVFDARQQGLDHIIPLEARNAQLDTDENGKECIRLDVHHLVEYDEETGEARIALSRLARLSIGKRDLEVAK